MTSTGSSTLPAHNATHWIQNGMQLASQQRLEEARLCFSQAIKLEPRNFEALHHLGIIAYKLKEYFLAIGYFQVAEHINPDNAVLLSNLGSIYKELKLFDLAKATYLKALALQNHFAPLHFNFANLLHEMHDTEGALQSYRHALALDPSLVPAYTNQGNMLTKLRKYDEARASYDQALTLNPQFGLAHANKGKLLKEQFDFPAALISFENAEHLSPQVAKVYVLKAELMNLMRDYTLAVSNFDKAYALDPHYEFLLGLRLHNKMLYCNWQHFDAEINQLVNSIESGHLATQPAQLLSLVDSPSLQLKACQKYVHHMLPSQEILGPIPRPPALNWVGEENQLPSVTPSPRKIKVAYVSADFKTHAVCILMAELFELHDKNRFEIFAFDSTPQSQTQGDVMRQRVFNAFDHVIDIRSMSDKEAATHARAMGIDIAVDLGGHTFGSRTGLFSYRAAPVQVSYLGYLGTLGAPYMDYLLADKTIIPEQSQIHYAEKIAYLPTYQVNDSKRQVSDKTFSRQDLGLPDTGTVYCCFNNNYKITPEVFNAWVKILHDVPGSSLFLLADNESAKEQLQSHAASCGLDPKRLVFGERLKPSEYLARYKTPDLFLDTFPYNAGTTASDALWVGLPVLTFTGQSFASRMAASALMGVGMPELITDSTEAYVQKAIELGTHPEKLASLKQQLKEKKPDSALFHTRRFVRHLENIYQTMIEKAVSGQSPQNIEIV